MLEAARLTAVLLFVPWLASCSLRGPTFTATARIDYNEAVQQSGRRELLLNLVRLRYIEGPEFLSIGSIASQMSFSAGASLGGSFGEEGGAASRLATPRGELGFSESPVATFTPRQDEAFMRRLVEPIALATLLALTRYGWSLERVMLVAVEEANGVRNVVTRETELPAERAEAERFAALARAMQALHERRWLEIDAIEEWVHVADVPAVDVVAEDHLRAAASEHRLRFAGDRSSYVLERRAQRPVLRLAAEARGDPEAAALLAGLGLSPEQSEFALVNVPTAGAIALRTRSVLGAMAYLSRGVAVPESHLAAGAAPRETQAAVPLRIVSAEADPSSAAVAVSYAGRWFYVEAADFESRRTFGALESLLRLQVGAGIEGPAPVLTLPLMR